MSWGGIHVPGELYRIERLWPELGGEKGAPLPWWVVLEDGSTKFWESCIRVS